MDKDLLLKQELNQLNIVRKVHCKIQRRLIKVVENIDISPVLDKNLRCLLISTSKIFSCIFENIIKALGTNHLHALCIGYSFLLLGLLMYWDE